MKYEVNAACNVRTVEGREPKPANPRMKTDVTLPRFHATLSNDEAHILGIDLIQAASIADDHRARLDPSFLRKPRPQYDELRNFAQMIARMTTSEEADACPEDNELVLGELIATARLLTGCAPIDQPTTNPGA